MKINALIMIIMVAFSLAGAQEKEILLLVRGDDMGSSHAANVGCIESYRDGIVRSVEIMVPTPWFLEAVEMLKNNPGLDVGIHLTLTSEWQGVKWRPLTTAGSIVNTNGYFYPMVWPNPKLPTGTAIHDHDWRLADMEQELRAQIELALRHLPRISHLTLHMGFASLDKRIQKMVESLAEAYHLPVLFPDSVLARFPGWQDAQSLQQRVDRFILNLSNLRSGSWLYVHHPAADTPEMRAIGVTPGEAVAMDRDLVTKVFTNPKVKEAIQTKNIRLVSYKDIIR